MRKIGILVALLLVAPAVSFAETLDELLAQQGVVTKGMDAGAGGGASKVYYNGGTRFEFPDTGFTAKWNTQVQTRYEYTDNDEGQENVSSFSVKRARLQVSGTALNNEFGYKLQVDFVGDKNDDGSSSPDLRDAYLEWHACDSAWVRMGQMKTLISRQNLNSSAMLQFADRSDASEFFAQDRGNGLAIGGNMDEFSWQAMMTNGQSDGEGRNRPGVDTDHSAYATVRYTTDGYDAFSEGDVDGSEDLGWSAGFTFGYNDDSLEGLSEDEETQTFNADFGLKVSGFSFAAEFYRNTTDQAEEDNNGFYAQAGYFLTPHEWELAIRHSLVTDDDDRDTKRNESSATINYYWWKHQLKANIGFVHLNEEEGDEEVKTNKWILQLSSWL